jgi:hypothetical protein
MLRIGIIERRRAGGSRGFARYTTVLLRSSLIGTGIGILPAPGPPLRTPQSIGSLSLSAR